MAPPLAASAVLTPPGGALEAERVATAAVPVVRLGRDEAAPPWGRCRFVHRAPGRVRIRVDPRRANPSGWARLEERLRGRPGLHAVRCSPPSRSVTVTYDPAALGPQEVLALVDRLAARSWPAAPEPGMQGRAGAGRPLRCRLVHALPGRVRVRLEGPRVVPRLIEALAHAAEQRRGVRSARGNEQARSIVVGFDPEVLSAEAIPAMLESIPLEDLDLAPMPAATPGRGAELRSSLVPLGLSGAALMGSPLQPLLLAAGALPIFARAGQAIFRRRRLDVHTLDAAATLVLAAQGQFGTASVMTCMVAVGDVIRDLTMQHAERALEEPFDGQLRHAWVVRGDVKVRVPVSQLGEGEEVVVYPGELIPVDGTVVGGRAAVDQQVLTGESMPIDKTVGDEVYAGTVVRDGKLYLHALHVGDETAAALVLQMVRGAPARETKAQNYAERFANRMVPYSFAGAAASMALAPNTGRAASLLIVDYGTGIRVSAPTAVLSSMAWAARRGILVKGGRHLETLADVGTVVFDKTGTLTTGRPELLEIRPCSSRLGSDEILALAAATEQRLTHPVAEAIVRAARERGVRIPDRESSDYRIGLGVEAMVGGRCVRVGGERFIAEGGIPLGPAAQWLSELNGRAASSLLVAVDGELAGLVVAADPIRTEAAAVVRALRERGVRDIVMLTGDHESVAARVARTVGIESFVAGVLPEEKAAVVRRLQAGRREVIAVVGDGINDSPALAQADVGIAMRGGADVARETAHVALLDGNLWQIPAAIDISRQAALLIRQNWRMTLWSNSVAIALAVAGVSGPALATLISNGSGVAATLNGLRPLMAGRRVHL